MFVFSSRRRHTRLQGDWSSDVCSSDLNCHDQALFAGVFLDIPPRYTSEQSLIVAIAPTQHARDDEANLISSVFEPEQVKIGRASCRKESRISWWPEQYKKKKRNTKKEQ